MKVLYILPTLILVCLCWDVHRGVNKIAAMAEAVRAKTDELLRRVPPTT